MRVLWGRGAIAGGTEHLTVKHTAMLRGCGGQKAELMHTGAFTSMHTQIYACHKYKNTHFISQTRERMCAKERRKRGILNTEGRLGAFPLALTGEINHHNYESTQVNGDRSALSFPSSRCFLLIRGSRALLPADLQPVRSECARDACETFGSI